MLTKQGEKGKKKKTKHYNDTFYNQKQYRINYGECTWGLDIFTENNKKKKNRGPVDFLI